MPRLIDNEPEPKRVSRQKIGLESAIQQQLELRKRQINHGLPHSRTETENHLSQRKEDIYSDAQSRGQRVLNKLKATAAEAQARE
jgi:hypothetical protein